MSKSFKDLVEALKKRRDTDDDLKFGNMGGKPRAPGEEDFAKDAYPVDDKIGGANDKASPFKNSDNVLNARKTKQTDMHDPPIVGGEKKPMKQGSSDEKAPFGFKGSRSVTRANQAASPGDSKVVRLSPSAVQPVTEQLEKILESDAVGDVFFEDGDHCVADPATAQALLETYHQLKPENAERFSKTINANVAGFLKMMKFAGV